MRCLRLASQWCIWPNIPASSSPLDCFQTIWQWDKDESIIELNSGLMAELISKRLASCNGNKGLTGHAVRSSEVGDIVVGTVLPPGSIRAIECRMAAFYAGFPDMVPIRTVNKQCSSGLQAVADVAVAIKAGFYDISIGAGLEYMTVDRISTVGKANPKTQAFAQARDCLLPMGITSENVVERYGVTKQEQDQAAVESHRRAAAATASGKFRDEIIPVSNKPGE